MHYKRYATNVFFVGCFFSVFFGVTFPKVAAAHRAAHWHCHWQWQWQPATGSASECPGQPECTASSECHWQWPETETASKPDSE